MAKTEESIRGKVGNTVFYRVGNETRVRSTASNYIDADTVKQRANRSCLRVAVRFYQHLKGTILQEAWKVAAGGSGINGYNAFMKLNMTVFRSDGKIGDFSRLQLSVGLLQKANHLKATVADDDTVTLTWEKGMDVPSARENDGLVVVLLYANRSFSPVFIDTDGATRGDGKAIFRLTRKQGTAAHLYSFFKEKEGKAYSASQYIRI